MNHMISKSVTNKINVKRHSISAIVIGAFVINALLILHITSLGSGSHLSGRAAGCLATLPCAAQSRAVGAWLNAPS